MSGSRLLNIIRDSPIYSQPSHTIQGTPWCWPDGSTLPPQSFIQSPTNSWSVEVRTISTRLQQFRSLRCVSSVSFTVQLTTARPNFPDGSACQTTEAASQQKLVLIMQYHVLWLVPWLHHLVDTGCRIIMSSVSGSPNRSKLLILPYSRTTLISLSFSVIATVFGSRIEIGGRGIQTSRQSLLWL